MRDLLICLCLAAATVAAYWPVHRFEFVHFDDDRYVYENPHVLDGLSGQDIAWAWRSPQIANYHPLTLMSLQLDATLFGARPGPYHVENLLLHVLATLLLFNFLKAATGDTWPSAFVAALFALHPTHVESVAWVSERKDVLSVVFMLLAMRMYVVYRRVDATRRTRAIAYAAMTACFVLGLLAKSMIVTMPLLLLLLDYWPMRRLMPREDDTAQWRARIVEKVPLFALSFAASAMAMRAQRAAGVVADLRAVPLRFRLPSIVVSYARYLGKTFWPVNLAPYYPYRLDWSAMQIGASAALLLVVTIAVVQLRQRRYLLVGWLWFLGTLVPVIGFVQVGSQSMADRYLYVPMIGLGMMIAWGAKDLIEAARSRAVSDAMAIAGVASLATLGVVTRHQVGYWRDTRTFFEHALAVVNDNATAHVRLGAADARDGNDAAATQHYQQALQIDPHNWAAAFNYGNLLLKSKPAAAIEQYQRAANDVRDAHAAAQVHNNLANALLAMNRPADAFEHLRAAERLDPDAFDPHYNLGQLLFRAGQYNAAASEFAEALRIKPDHPGAQRAMALTRERLLPMQP